MQNGSSITSGKRRPYKAEGKDFGSGSAVTRGAGRSEVRTEITAEHHHEIKEAFELFDTDKDGAIDFQELKVSRWSYLLNRLRCVR